MTINTPHVRPIQGLKPVGRDTVTPETYGAKAEAKFIQEYGEMLLL